MRTSQNISYLYSEGHPFATNGPIHGGLIAPETGTYSLSMQGSAAADYVVDLRVLRPPLETSSQQVLYLTMWGDRLLQIYDLENGDVMNLSVYDNPTVNPANYNDSPYTDGDGAGPYPNIDLEVNPLIFYADEMFMLEEEHTIDPENNPIPPYYISDMEFFIGPGIVQRVKEHFPQVDVRLGPPITNTFDIDYVESYAEIVIGSEAAQVNINSLAVAESIDLGNFDITDHGIVMMDEITGAIPLIPFEYPRSPDNTIDEMNSNIVYTDMILGTIANITAHVAAHLFGVLHTDSVSFANNIMDPRLPSVFGVQAFYPITGTGLDGIFSTVDDDYPFFGVDEFFSPEGYIGPQDTDKTLFYSLGGNSTLSSMTSDFSNLFVDFNWSSDGNGSKPLPFNQLQLAIDMIDTGGTVNIASGTGDETFSGVGRIDRPMTLQSSSPSSGPIRIGDEARPNFLRAR